MMLGTEAAGMGASDPALITILEIKAERLDGAGKTNLERELALLNATLDASGLAIDAQLQGALRPVNLELWTIEDDIRE